MYSYAQKQNQPQPDTLFSSALLPSRTRADRSLRQLTQDESNDLESGATAPSRFAHSFARTPVHTGSNKPDALRERDMEGQKRSGDAAGLPNPSNTGAKRAATAGAPAPAGQSPAATTTTTTPAPIVVFPLRIRGLSSPWSMPDRIPPRKTTPVRITIANLAAGQRVTLSIEGNGGSNGSATINGKTTENLNTSGTVHLRGETQTDPGNAGNLELVARLGTEELFASEGFSVSSIPENCSIKPSSEKLDKDHRGLVVENHWESDSGDPADLGEVQRSEQVQYGDGTGIYRRTVVDVGRYRRANDPPSIDEHSTPLERLKRVPDYPGGSFRTSLQTFTFNDWRSHTADKPAMDIPIPKSGFRIERMASVFDGGIEFIVDKRGEDVTTGFASEAGEGHLHVRCR